jgi:hypothetical protein
LKGKNLYLPPASGESIAEVYCRDGFDEEGDQQVGEGNIGQQQVTRLRLQANRPDEAKKLFILKETVARLSQALYVNFYKIIKNRNDL